MLGTLGPHRVTGQLDCLGGIIPHLVLCHQQPQQHFPHGTVFCQRYFIADMAEMP